MDMCHGPDPADMQRGAYILLDPHKGFGDCAVIFDEKDAQLIKKAAMILSVQGIAARLIAVRDFALFTQQDEDYRNKVLRCDLPLYAAVSDGCMWAANLSAKRFAPQDAYSLANCIKSAIFPE